MNRGASVEFDERMQAMPVIAILRGLSTGDAVPVGEALLGAGITVAEVPLNSPQPFDTIAMMRGHFGDRLMIGAGTVLSADDAERSARAGAQFCVAPNVDPEVIGACLRLGMLPVPGFQSATEAFAAVAAGARHLKAYPAQSSQLSAVRAVLPKDVALFAVGGATPGDVATLLAAGARGFGVGGDLYRPGRPAAEVETRADQWAAAVRSVFAMRVELVCNPRAVVGEGPVEWRGRIFWVDPVQSRLLSFDPHDQTHEEHPLSAPVWSLAVRPDGGLVGNGETHFVAFDAHGRRTTAGPTIALGPGCRLNDLVVDARGGLWGGSMHKGILAGRGGIFHAACPRSPARQVASGLGVANGMAFSADQRTLYVIDTLQRTLLAYPARTDEGALGEPVIVTDFLGLPGKPDGMAMDAEGNFWVAMWGAGQVVQIAPNGAVLKKIDLPAPHVGSVCITANGDVYVSTALARLGAEALLRAPGSGGLFRISGV